MGLGMVLDIARSAMAAQQYGMEVTGHNIANVSTEGFSRQSPVMTAKEPSTAAGLFMGRGVDVDQIIRASDQFIENQLMQEKAGMVSSREMESYMQILEGMFNENSDASLSTMLASFWNLWHDISNNPSGASERVALYEHSQLLAERFRAMAADLGQIKTDLSGAISVGIEEINQITDQIAQLNTQIVRMETNSVANDLRDQRNALISGLSEYIDVKTFEQPSGAISVVTARGCILVNDDRSFELELGGSTGDRVRWLGANNDAIDITDYISNGKLGGWLNMRDETVAKTQLDLDAVAKELIWLVNQQHSQGVGLKLFEPGTTINGTYQAPAALGDLEYNDRIQFVTDAFKLWIEDRTDPTNPTISDVSIDLSGLNSASTLAEFATAVNNQIAAAGLTGVTVDGSGTSISFAAANNYAFGFSEDRSNILAALGVNTFFGGAKASSIEINTVLSDKDYIAAAQIDAGGSYGSGDNTNALAILDRQYATTEISQWTCDRIGGYTEGKVTATIEGYYHAIVGAIGIKSSSISNARVFKEEMVNKLNNIRDSISAVSLDEEMTNLIEFQHAFTAAAKLVSVTDEMMKTLLAMK